MVLLFLLFFLKNNLSAQQQLTVTQCEELLQKNNLYLLAEQYNIDASKAALIQAKIWEQPYFSGEINAINPADNRYFDAGKNGQKSFAIQQLIYLGGKKRNEVAFAKSNIILSELQYEQLLRSLKFQLAQSFYTIYYDQIKANSIRTQINSIDSLTKAYETQVSKGNIPLKDLVRLQSLSISLKNELMEIDKNILQEQQNLRLLTSAESPIIPIISDTNNMATLLNKPMPNVSNIEQLAVEKNTDYLYYQKVAESNELMLKWQKSMAVPDLNIGAAYDQRGGAFNNQVGLTFGIPLPLWNQNKGNIQAAKVQVMQSKTLKEQKLQELKYGIQTSYEILQQQRNLYHQFSVNVTQNMQKVYEGFLYNFHKKNVSLIEFTDFMESYNQTIVSFNEMKKNIVVSGENINFLANEKIF
ncbi:TolC family protein [Flexibacter flexilis]|uniref:TolC family protein n=1 Tax=Flexibacter flexilis TaxID=998 RepID=UPI001FDFF748|nr:TolC family protein [Flexibacter flexilis]